MFVYCGGFPFVWAKWELSYEHGYLAKLLESKFLKIVSGLRREEEVVGVGISNRSYKSQNFLWQLEKL